ncbi:hypothetical protein [Lactiplantibacillus plantarum]|nr:hypothetical protein [Lactiplantibacillus plantarum]AOB20766.1 hypothetical protein AVR82_14520 [Lactiplantibacillus plantarum]AOB21435.1 hypothetical protein AVR83_00115 [Lactiplantibacillus plantarum]AOB24421.1 hypothetical protein AVR83_16335 [Lactiplantibacillus plantarum]ASZ33100.1 hypothetical protein CLC99_07420 [Lactiplantibacillus plantarum]MBF9194241.1 hypothetical protein [Lactiplantibacillus plantarum]
MTDTEYAKAIREKARMASLGMSYIAELFPNDEPFVNKIQAQIGQEFIADIMKLSDHESKQKAAY